MPAAKGVLSTCVMSDIQSKGFCNLIPMAIFKGPSEGFAEAGVWSRKRSLAALGGGLVVSSHSRGHCWKNPISSWFRGPFDITVIRGSTISFQLLTLESYWNISVPYLCGQSTLVAERRAPWDFISGSGGPTFFFLTALENFSQRQWSNFHLATL